MDWTLRVIATTLLLSLFSPTCAFGQGQSAIVQTQVNNPASPGLTGGYGIDSIVQGNSVELGRLGEATRHHRFGESTGIGSSTFQTTSATVESMKPQVNSDFASNQIQGQANFLTRQTGQIRRIVSGTPALGGLSALTPKETFSSNIRSVPRYNSAQLNSSFIGRRSDQSQFNFGGVDYSKPLGQGAGTDIGAQFGF